MKKTLVLKKILILLVFLSFKPFLYSLINIPSSTHEKKFKRSSFQAGNFTKEKIESGLEKNIYRIELKDTKEQYCLAQFKREYYHRYNNELFFLKLLRNTKGIINLIDYSSKKRQIITELAAMDLVDYMELHPKLDNSERFMLIKKILKSICRLHEIKIIHRDIKAENIVLFIGEQGDIKISIIDFCMSLQIPKNMDYVEVKNSYGSISAYPPDFFMFKLSKEGRGQCYKMDCKYDISGLGSLIYFILYSQLACHNYVGQILKKENISTVSPQVLGHAYRKFVLDVKNKNYNKLNFKKDFENINSMIKKCWNWDPKKRPEAIKILEIVEKELLSLKK